MVILIFIMSIAMALKTKSIRDAPKKREGFFGNFSQRGGHCSHIEGGPKISLMGT